MKKKKVKNSSLVFSSKFEKIQEINKEFTLAKCYVCAEGPNRNFSVIQHDTIVKATPTLFNIPVMAHLYEDEEGSLQAGGHDVEIQVDDNGDYYFHSLTVPFGVVPERPNDVYYEEVEESDGTTKTYMVCPVILWTGRFPELTEAYIDEQKMFSQSMEIIVKDYKAWADDKNYTEITDFDFSALCLLGEGVEPCFPESKVGMFSLEDAKFSELFAQLKTELADCFNSEEGGKTMDSEKIELTEEEIPEATEEEIPEATEEEIPEATEDEVEAQPEVSEGESEEPVEDPEPAAEESFEAQTFSLTYQEKRDIICEALYALDRDGVSHWLMDFSDEELYVERYSGTCEHFKVTYVFDEGNQSVTISDVWEPIFCRWLTQSEIDALDSMKAEYELLIEYKANKEDDERKASLDEALNEFEDLAGNAEFDAIVENKYSYESVEALKNACYIVRGKFGLIPAKKKESTTEPIIPIENTESAKKMTAREKLHAEFGKKKI